MNYNVGLWIDHLKTYIIFLKPNGEVVVKTIKSEVESQKKSTGGVGTTIPYSKGGLSTEKTQQRRQHQLKSYYENIIHEIVNIADKIYLFGPGQAKKELLHEMNKTTTLPQKIIAVEPADNITEPQMIAKVKNFYKLK